MLMNYKVDINAANSFERFFFFFVCVRSIYFPLRLSIMSWFFRSTVRIFDHIRRRLFFCVFSTVFKLKRLYKHRFTIGNESAVSLHHSMDIWINRRHKKWKDRHLNTSGFYFENTSVFFLLFLRINKIVKTNQMNCIHHHLLFTSVF